MAEPIVLAASFGEVPFPGAHEAWCSPSDLADVASPGNIDVATVCGAASAILRAMSGRRYGVRRITVRPSFELAQGSLLGFSPTPTGSILTSSSWGPFGRGWDVQPQGIVLDAPASVLEIAVDGAWLAPAYADGVVTQGSTTLGSQHAAFAAADVGQPVLGPGIPAGATIVSVASSTQATMSAAASASGSTPFTLPSRPAGWHLYDRRLLVRADGVQWPSYQDLTRDLSQPQTWGITYESGTAVPPEGRLAAVALAGEILKLLVRLMGGQSGECVIPERVTSVSRQGVSWTLDATQFLKDGRTGVFIADLWLESLNQSRKKRRASIASPETLREVRQ